MRSERGQEGLLESAHHVDRLVAFSAQHPQYESRRARRARMLELRPIDPTERVSHEAVSSHAEPGVHWELLLADDSPLLVRSRDLIDERDAHADARTLFADTVRVRPVYVRDPRSGHLSWWLVRGAEPVFVASRVWLPTQRTAVVSSAQKAHAALRVQPPWGRYDG